MTHSLEAIAAAMVTSGKGILAADESTGTCKKRFEQLGIDSSEENRRLYRQMLFTAADIEKYIGGVILFDETLRQSTDDGVPFPELLKQKNILPGIKLDAGTKELANFPGEKHTEGLDGLRERLPEYVKLGVKFAKWRAVISIDGNKGFPSETCLKTNAQELAQYAAICQEAGIVPIVEPEILIDGNHTIQECEKVTTTALNIVFEELKNHRVNLKGIILKPSMVIAGKDCPQQASVEEVADATVRTLKKCVPKDVPGIAFLSGGQTDIQATENLNAMNARHKDLPWKLTFSYGRALQQPALKSFAEGNIPEAQKQLVHRAKMNGAASEGKYISEMENEIRS